jgi:hypothetical protein
MSDTAPRTCPLCGREVVDNPRGGPRRRFDTDECRKRWNAENGVRATEVGWLRDKARDGRANANFHKGAVSVSWAKAADKYDREADRLDTELAERRGSVNA